MTTTQTPPAAKETKATTNGAAKKTGLGKPLAAVLEALGKAKSPLTRAEISEKTGIGSGFTSILGHVNPEAREPQSLAARGYIRPEKRDEAGKDVIRWSITAAGRKALEAAKKVK